VFVQKHRLPVTGGDDVALWWDLVRRHLEPSLIATNADGGDVRRFVSLRPAALGGVFFYLAAPLIAMRSKPDAVVCKSPYEAFVPVVVRRLLRRGPRVVVEIHGDWGAYSRYYGSRSRRYVAPIADAMAAWTVRRADRVRAVGAYTESLARRAGYRGPIDVCAEFAGLGDFLDPTAPMPADPVAAFVGRLERVKGIDVLIEHWPDVAARVPGARLVVAGEGPLAAAMRRRVADLGLDDRVTLVGHLPRTAVRDLLDRSRCLVVPSRSEGLGLVAIEAACRARPVVGSATGGIPETVADGRTGILVAPGDGGLLAEAVAALLGDADRAAAMGGAARRAAQARTPERDYERWAASLAAWLRDGCAPSSS
jgi:glycosyltransferase involved in cell wall biosynthesis